MDKYYYRVSYKDVGIYDAFKKEVWKRSKNPKEEWENLKKSEEFCWLKIPNVNYKNCCSYFTKLGYELFKVNTYKIFLKYLDEDKIRIEKYNVHEIKLDILYEDEHQIVVKID